jgi:hypothetical protein
VVKIKGETMGYAEFIKIIDASKAPSVESILATNGITEDDVDRDKIVSGIRDFLEAIKKNEFSINLDCGGPYAQGVSMAQDALNITGATQDICLEEVYTETRVIAGIKINQ